MWRQIAGIMWVLVPPILIAAVSPRAREFAIDAFAQLVFQVQKQRDRLRRLWGWTLWRVGRLDGPWRTRLSNNHEIVVADKRERRHVRDLRYLWQYTGGSLNTLPAEMQNMKIEVYAILIGTRAVPAMLTVDVGEAKWKLSHQCDHESCAGWRTAMLGQMGLESSIAPLLRTTGRKRCGVLQQATYPKLTEGESANNVTI